MPLSNEVPKDGVTRRRFLATTATAGAGAAAMTQPWGAVAHAQGSGPGLTVAAVTTEHATNPLGLDVGRPRLGWLLESGVHGQAQTAYQVVVASSVDRLGKLDADVWDSGKLASADSVDVRYDGPALASRTRYHWKVRVWDREGRASAWSAPAWWETGLLTDDDWGGAAWIGSPPDRIESEGVVTAWEFGTAGDAEGWTVGNNLEPFEVADGYLSTVVTGSDPFMHSPAVRLDAGTARLLRLRLRTDAGSGVSVYFVTEAAPGWSEANKVAFPVDADGGFHDYLLDLGEQATGWRGTVTQLRVDLDGADAGTALTIDSVRVERGRTVHLVTGSPLLRKDFQVTKRVERARAYVSGLGYYVLSIDGTRIGDHVLDPGFTVYDKTALYATYDVTAAVRGRGAHVVGVTLGRGFFALPAEDTKYWGSAPWLGDPRLRLRLEVDYADGSHESVVSDGGWTVGSGPTTRDSVYLGETYDARLVQPGWDRPGFDPAGWFGAAEVPAPTATLRSQAMEPIRVVDTLRAERISSPRPGTYVFSFPVVTAGWARLRVSGPAGTEVTLRYGETLRADGTVNNDGDAGLTNGPVQTDRYLLRGEGTETWEPSFSYSGFQHVQVDGYPGRPDTDDLVAQVVHTDVPSTGRFTSSDELLNTIHAMTRRTMLNNLHSVMTDTPMFEKRAWLGDVAVLVPATINNFGMHRFYRNWLISITDNQGADGAGVELSPNPFPAGYTDPIWAGALVEIPWQLYQEYGDTGVLVDTLDAMAGYVDYLAGRSDGLIQEGFYGDWVSPATSGTFPWPPEGARLTGTAYFHRHATTVSRAARALGRDADATRFADLADRIKAAFNAAFLDRAAGHYRTERDVGYRQTSNAVPLTFGLVPPELVGQVARRLVADVVARGNHLNTGHAGTKELLPALTEHGHVDTAFALATQRTYPSWGYWVDQGATTLWEAWEDNTRSRDHAFLGSVDDWFYRYLAGLSPTAPGYERIAVKPYVPHGLRSAEGTVGTVRGTLTSRWQRQGRDGFSLEVEIPVNATAEIFVPAADGSSVRPSPGTGATYLRTESGYAVFAAGSGRHQFLSRL